MAHKLQFANKL